MDNIYKNKDMKEKKAIAQAKLNVESFYIEDFTGISTILHLDGSSFIFHHSCMVEDVEFVFVGSEHNGKHFWHKEDLEIYTFIEYEKEKDDE
jgi:hypothetical protein